MRDADRAAARLDVHAFVRTAGKVEGQSWWYLEGEKRCPREVKYEWSDRPCVALSRVRGVIHARKGPRVIMTDAEASDDCSTDTTTVPLVALVIRGETYWVVRRESDGQHDYVLMRIVDGFPQAVEMSRR